RECSLVTFSGSFSGKCHVPRMVTMRCNGTPSRPTTTTLPDAKSSAVTLAKPSGSAPAVPRPPDSHVATASSVTKTPVRYARDMTVLLGLCGPRCESSCQSTAADRLVKCQLHGHGTGPPRSVHHLPNLGQFRDCRR